MGNLLGTYIMPHPPVIVPEIGKGREQEVINTLNSMDKVGRMIKDNNPDTVIVISPHSPVFKDYFFIRIEPTLTGTFRPFGFSNLKQTFQNDIDLINLLIEASKNAGIHAGGLSEDLLIQYSIEKEIDHGVLVPMYYINKYLDNNCRLVNLSFAATNEEELYNYGKCIYHAIKKSNKNVVLIASGDLSHCLKEDGPYGFTEEGIQFDQIFVDSIKNDAPEKLFNLNVQFKKKAGECGVKSFMIMYGVLDTIEYRPKLLSYEGPFGVGYGVVAFEIIGEVEDRKFFKKVNEKLINNVVKERKKESIYVKLARETIETYIKTGSIMKPSDDLPKEMLEGKRGVFVSIKKNDRLRGCIGTILPNENNIALEIINNAISASTKDPRFNPITENELELLSYSVDILFEPEPITSMDELNVKKYGVIVTKGFKRGLLLPNLEGVNNVEEQVDIALNKAGIQESDAYKMERFEVVRYY